MPTTGPVYPTVEDGTDSSNGGVTVWSPTGNAGANDGVTTDCTYGVGLLNGDPSVYLKCTGFSGFSGVPDTDIVSSLLVEIKHKATYDLEADPRTKIYVVSFRILKAGVIDGGFGNIANPTTTFATVSDEGLFGATLTGADLKDAGFGIAIEATNWDDSGSNVNVHQIDFVRVTATHDAAPTTPNAPSNLVATAVSSTQINLTWDDNSSDETKFELERSPDGSGSWVEINEPAANVESYSDTGLSPATTYYYRIKATNGAGSSSYSSTANATTDPATGSNGLLLLGVG